MSPFLLAGLLIVSAISMAASARIELDTPDRSVETSEPSLVHVEPHLSIDPGDPNHWIAGSIVVAPDQVDVWRCDLFVSRDAGSSWTRHGLDVDRCIDPWLLQDAEGNATWVGIAIAEQPDDDRRFELVRSNSADGGSTWTVPETLGRAFEHPQLFANAAGAVWLLARETVTPHRSARQVASLLRAQGHGESFENQARLRPADTPADLNVTGLAQMAGGTWAVGIVEYSPYRTRVLRTDAEFKIVSVAEVTTACGESGPTFPGYPMLLGSSDGRTLFHLCTGPSYRGLWLSRSIDGGESWTEAMAVDGVDPKQSHVRTPMAALNAEGVLGLAWYDRRHDPDRRCQHLYFTASLDGGATVLPPVRVSSEGGCPGAPGNGRAGAASWHSGGDYSSLVALPDGRFAVVWADARSGVIQLRSAILRIESEGR